MPVKKSPRSDVAQRLDRIEKQLKLMQADIRHLSDFDPQTESIIERKVYEIKAIAYVTLVIASVLMAMVLGMVLNAMGIHIF